MQIPDNILQDIKKYKPINIYGLDLYPIIADEYDNFILAKPAIEFMQQTLPVGLLSIPILSAFFKIDLDAKLKGETATGLFYKSVLFLVLSLRIGFGLKTEERIKMVEIKVNPSDMSLQSINFEINGKEKIITPTIFQKIRPILAYQNGIEVISENANPDLIEAEYEIATQNMPPMELGIEPLVTMLANISNKDESEIYSWPICKVNNRAQAFRRIIDYMACSLAESQGTKWKGGNPVPHPFFKRLKNSSAALIPLQSFAGGEGVKAMQKAGLISANN